MSKQNLEKTFLKELEILNDRIDEKIIKGMSYVNEARRHKFLLRSLANLRRSTKSQNWFSKSFGFVSTFIF